MTLSTQKCIQPSRSNFSTPKLPPPRSGVRIQGFALGDGYLARVTLACFRLGAATVEDVEVCLPGLGKPLVLTVRGVRLGLEQRLMPLVRPEIYFQSSREFYHMHTRSFERERLPL